MVFNINIGEIKHDSIQLRVWSEKEITLNMRDIKFFCDNPNKGDPCLKTTFAQIHLNSEAKQIRLHYPEIKSYRSITFIIEDLTNKKQFATSIIFETNTPKFKEMPFGS